jgi:hypothetical protein
MGGETAVKGRLTSKKKAWAMAAAVVAGSMVILAGCVRQTNIPIVSERTAEDPNSSEAQKAKGEPEAEKQGDRGQEEGGLTGLIKEQTKAPERYQVHIQGEDVTVTADVEVDVPKTDKICLNYVEYSPYTDEELEQIKGILEEELTDEELTYTFDLSAGDSENLPIIWLSATDVSDGAGGAGNSDDLSEFPITEAELEQLEAALASKAERLLQKMDLKDFSLESTRWRQLSVSGGASWTLSGQYGVRLYYSRIVGDLPLVNSERGRGSLRPRSQYVEFLYRADGTLLAVKNIGRERIEDSSEYAGFLLPFSSVSQIFEQCMRTLKIHGDFEGKQPHIYLTVTDVKLAYGMEYGDRIGDMPQTYGRKGKLVPVWVFYGIVEQGYQKPDGTDSGIPRIPLGGGMAEAILSINGENGTIYGEPPAFAIPPQV